MISSGLLVGLTAGCVDGGPETGEAASELTTEVVGRSSAEPFLVPRRAGVSFQALLSVGDTGVDGAYPLVGIPDGLGAFGDRERITILVNHELGFGQSRVHGHGERGAFVSRWTIDRRTGEILGGRDQIERISTWEPIRRRYLPAARGVALARLCSADLATPLALLDRSRSTATGADAAAAALVEAVAAPVDEGGGSAAAGGGAVTRLGYGGRLFLDGEEGAGGRAFAHDVATGTSYQLPRLGRMGFENVVARPAASPWTVVAATDDAVPGEVVIYRGHKRATGNPIERAGLDDPDGRLYGLSIPGLRVEGFSQIPRATRVTLFDLGDVRVRTGPELQAIESIHGVTGFARPEDIGWNPADPDQLFFATTGSGVVPTRLWRLTFDDGSDPAQGAMLDILVDGSRDLVDGVAPRNLDNLTVSADGRYVYLQEDAGFSTRLAKLWRFDLATETLELLAEHDPARFTPGLPGYLTLDEESSGIIDVSALFGPGRFLLTSQVHRAHPDPELVELGQLLLMTVED